MFRLLIWSSVKVQPHDEYHQERFCLEGILNKNQQYLHLEEAEWHFEANISFESRPVWISTP